jgi:diaminopimelate epimerase
MRFSKWHALGNAYLLVERAELGRPLEADEVRRLCDPRAGIGSDGLLEAAADDSFLVWNPDGSRAEFSGNGARIAAGWVLSRSRTAEEVRLRVGERDVTARRHGRAIALDVGRVEVGAPEILHLGGAELEFTPVSVGNPHAVFRRRHLEGEIDRLGPLIETHERFSERTNVQFVMPLGRDELRLEVWERGAGRTSSSGSSAVAAAAAAVANGWCESPLTVVLPGAGDLLVEVDSDASARLVGPVEEICRGVLVAPLSRTDEPLA